MLAMNRVGYDAMAVGNHEFNFGLEALGAARAAARFPWLSANTVTDGSMPAFAPYLLKTVGGVKVAVIGLTTPAMPQWEKPENIRGLSWLAPEEAVRRALAALEAETPDVTLVAMHSGLGREPGAAEASPFELPGENAARAVAERFPGLAAVVYGHSHARDPGRRVGGVLLVQPKNWAMDVARIDLELEREPGRPLPPAELHEPADPGDCRDAARPRDPRARAPVPRGRRAPARQPRDRVAHRALGRSRPLRGLGARRRDPRGAAPLREGRRELRRALPDARRVPARPGHPPRAGGALPLRQRALRDRGQRPHGARGAREREPLLPDLPRSVVRERPARGPRRSRASTTRPRRASRTRSTSGSRWARASSTSATAAVRCGTTSRCGSRSTATAPAAPRATRCSRARGSCIAAAARSAT